MKNKNTDLNTDLLYHLVIYKNDKEKIFHIQTTKVKNPKVSCTLKIQLARSLYAISGKDSAQCAATTSFIRSLLVFPNLNDWDRKIIPLGNVNCKELIKHYKKYEKELKDVNYKQVTRYPHVRHYEKYKKYNTAFLKMIVTNLDQKRFNIKTTKILEDFNVTKDIDKKVLEIYNYVLKDRTSPVNNVSQLLRHILFTYTNFDIDRIKRVA